MIGDMCTKFKVDPSHKKEVSEWTPFRLQTDGQGETRESLTMRL